MLKIKSIKSKLKLLHSLEVKNFELINEKAYINGKWVDSCTNNSFEVLNPANNELVGCVPSMIEDDAAYAIDKAYNAFKTWKNTTNKERSQLLRNWYNLLVKNTEELAKIITLESGKPLQESRAEIMYGNSFVEWYSEESRRINGEIIPSPDNSKQLYVYKEPIGVAGLITPWNFPHAMITRKASAALAAGCTIVLKPAEDTPLTALAMAKLAEDACFPKGVFNVVTCDRRTAPLIGKLFCSHPLIAGVSFTGSSPVGKQLYKWCSSGVKRITLELGGNSPFIVFPTANMKNAVQGAMQAKFRNSGQACVAANKFILHSSIYDEFVCKIKKMIQKLKMGYGMEEDTNIGPLINKAQFEKIKMLVDDAKCKGAEIVVGGKRDIECGKLFYKPTLVTGVNKDMKLYKEEIFGPIAACMKFSSEEEAIEMANDTKRGLAGYFYSNDLNQIFRVAAALKFGMLGVNQGLIAITEAPLGGIKESGIGREGSSHGIDDYVNLKYICLGNLK